MDGEREELADLLRRLESTPNLGSARLRGAVIANRLALRDRDMFWADIAETLACEDAPGATRALRDALQEQAALAGATRRAVASGTRLAAANDVADMAAADASA